MGSSEVLHPQEGRVIQTTTDMIMMILPILLVAAIGLAVLLGTGGQKNQGTGHAQPNAEEEDDGLQELSYDEIHSAVLSKIHWMNFSSFSLGAAEEKLNRVREYRKKCEAMPKGRVRQAYLSWMDHFERTALGEIADYQPEARKKFYDDWEKDRAELRKADERARRIAGP
jgi:hypothetical protein